MTRRRPARARSWSCRCSACRLFLGFYPKPVLDRIEPTVDSGSSPTLERKQRLPRAEAAGASTRIGREGAGRAEATMRARSDEVIAASCNDDRRPRPIDWLAIAPELALVRRRRSLIVLAARAPSATTIRRATMARVRHGASPACSAAGVFRSGSGSSSTTTARSGPIGGHGRGRRLRRVPRDRRRASRRCSRCCSSVGYLRREQLEAPEYFALMLFSAAGMMLMASANDLIVVFLALEILSIPLYVLAAFDRRRLELAGSGPQVLRARRVLVGDLPLRHRARLRRDRHDEPHRDRRLPRARTRCSTTGMLLAGFALLLVGLGLQGRGGAVPHVDARRVPGRADAGHRVHGRRRRRRRRSRRCCGSSSCAFAALPRRLAPGGLGPRRALARSSGSVGRRADRREAHARLLVDQPRRLRPHRRAGRPRTDGDRAALFYLLAYAFMVVGRFAVVTVVGAHRRRRPLARRLPRAWPAPAGARPAVHCSSCSRRPACRSPGASSPSSASRRRRRRRAVRGSRSSACSRRSSPRLPLPAHRSVAMYDRSERRGHRAGRARLGLALAPPPSRQSASATVVLA